MSIGCTITYRTCSLGRLLMIIVIHLNILRFPWAGSSWQIDLLFPVSWSFLLFFLMLVILCLLINTCKAIVTCDWLLPITMLRKSLRSYCLNLVVILVTPAVVWVHILIVWSGVCSRCLSISCISIIIWIAQAYRPESIVVVIHIVYWRRLLVCLLLDIVPPATVLLDNLFHLLPRMTLLSILISVIVWS